MSVRRRSRDSGDSLESHMAAFLREIAGLCNRYADTLASAAVERVVQENAPEEPPKKKKKKKGRDPDEPR